MSESLKLKLSFLLVLSGLVGSLFFSEVLNLPPCSLCWFQRIAMYPLVIIFGIALWLNDHAHRRYSLPLVILGLAVSGFHNLLYYELIPSTITPCSQGVSCTSKQLEVFGFITIPLLALLSFVLLAVLNFKKFNSGESE